MEAVNKIKTNKRITENDIKDNLWTKTVPDVDLIVRTGIDGDPHLSGNVLLWQTSYSQLYFTDTLWPDLKTVELKKAIADYSKRERRKGK
jgi:undecaprenyl diphosphate synthase